MAGEAYDKGIKDEIDKLWSSDMFRSLLKCTKRIWAFSRINKLDEHVIKLTPLVTGNISHLYQIKSRIDAFIRVMNSSQTTSPTVTISQQLQQIKTEIANILQLQNNVRDKIYDMIDEICKLTGNKFKITKLELLKDFIFYYVNCLCLEELDKLGYNPPPRLFFPKIPKYKIQKLHQEDL